MLDPKSKSTKGPAGHPEQVVAPVLAEPTIRVRDFEWGQRSRLYIGLRLKLLLNSRVRCVKQSVYTLDAATLGQFDVVLFLGVLYHLRYPLLAVDKIRTVCRGTAYVETHVIDNYFLLRDGAATPPTMEQVHPRLPGVPVWRFYKDGELHQDPSNWFGPNTQAVREAFGMIRRNVALPGCQLAFNPLESAIGKLLPGNDERPKCR